MRPLILWICLVTSLNSVIGQKENNIWYFGNRAGLDFNFNPPIAIESELVAKEGTASISDPAGHLLFYTNGITIWDRNHNVMSNGTGLLGGESSTQAVLIVPLPKSNDRYYVFTTEDYLTNGGMNYSIVNMNLNGGFGDVEPSSKNILVVDQVGEKVTGILHSNGLDIWIITHKMDSNEFLSYLLTSNGLNMVPVISPIGSVYPASDPIGPIRSSHSGTRIISTSTYNSILEIFDFNKNTGEISNMIDLYHLFNDPQYVYGIEFSPNDSLVYLSSYLFVSNLFQIELTTYNLITLSTSNEDYYGALQLGPDNHIYLANNSSLFLDIIREPNKTGLSCLYEPKALSLNKGTSSTNGLPNLAPYSFFRDNSDFSLGQNSVLCQGDSLILTTNFPIHCDSLNFKWSDGSIGSEIVVKSNGNYWLEVTSPCFHFIDTIGVSFIPCEPIVYYDLNACRSVMADGSHMDYSEFVPAYPYAPICAEVSANHLYRNSITTNKHSCTPGINNSAAMCVSTLETCEYDPGSSTSIIIEFYINPALDSVFQITGLEFFEKGPLTYNWVNGSSGLNNYPKFYGIRILKNGVEIFRKENVNTNASWTLQNYDFTNDSSFTIKESSDFRIELLPYCPVGNNADVSAWDLDEIMIFGGCVSVNKSIINGKLISNNNHAISGVEMQLSSNSSFSETKKKSTDSRGKYFFNNLPSSNSYFIRGLKNDDILNGVSTLDLIHLQRNLLGLERFTSLDQLIAADINHNEKISVLDLVELRKVLLGIYTYFPNNTSWRFGALPLDIIESDFSKFKEVHHLPIYKNDTLTGDFIGIKIGDLNGDVFLPDIPKPGEQRSFNSIDLILNDVQIIPNKVFKAQFRLEQELDIYGLQFAMDLSDMQLISISSDVINFTNENYYIQNGILKISWNSIELTQITSKAIILNIELMSDRGGLLSNIIYEFYNVLNSEIYLESLEAIDLNLRIEKTYQIKEENNCIAIESDFANAQVIVHYFLELERYVEIQIFDLSGRCIFQNRKKGLAGDNSEIINYSNIAGSGFLICQLITNGLSTTEKFVKLD